MYGTVTRYFHHRGFGFIYGEDKCSYFVHYRQLGGEYIDEGYYVFFRPFQNDRSDYNAKDIMVIEACRKRRGKRERYNCCKFATLERKGSDLKKYRHCKNATPERKRSNSKKYRCC